MLESNPAGDSASARYFSGSLRAPWPERGAGLCPIDRRNTTNEQRRRETDRGLGPTSRRPFKTRTALEKLFPANTWVGTTVDCQARVVNAEGALRKVKAGVKWLSCEPLIPGTTRALSWACGRERIDLFLDDPVQAVFRRHARQSLVFGKTPWLPIPLRWRGAKNSPTLSQPGVSCESEGTLANKGGFSVRAAGISIPRSH
jgi:hypothetical protein